MHRSRLILAVSFALAGLAGAARADVLVVHMLGGGDFTSLSAAAAAAQDGDVLLVKYYSPSWPLQTLTLGDKSLTVIADGGLPDVDHIVVQGLPAGKVVVLRGLEIDAGLELIDNAGSIRVEHCQLRGLSGSPGGPIWGPAADGQPAVIVSGCTDVALSSCTVDGGPGADVIEDETDFNPTAGGAGLQAETSLVTLAFCTLRGGHGGSDYDDGDSGKPGGAGVSNLDATLVLQGGALIGGDGGNGGCNLFPSFCGGGGAGGHGLLSVSPGAANLLRDITTQQGGDGGAGAGGLPDGPAGHPIQVLAGALVIWPQPAGRFNVSSPVREGETLDLLATGLPGDAIWILASFSPAQLVKPAYKGSFLLGAPLILQLPIGVIPAEGSLQLGVPAPSLPAAMESLNLFMQTVTNRSGAWLFAPASTLTLLDASF